MRIASDPNEVGKVREAVLEHALQAGLSRRDADALTLATHEAVMNAIEHGNRSDPGLEVTIHLRESEDRVEVQVLDHGPGLSATPAPFRPLADRGRGIALMRGLVDELRLSRARGEAVLVMRKKRGEET
jgi:serine/threonine-protein kinase RsbW